MVCTWLILQEWVTLVWIISTIGAVGHLIHANEVVDSPEYSLPARSSHDLQHYHDDVELAKKWAEFSETANSEKYSKDHTRRGNWTKFDCMDPRIVHRSDYTPSERWKGLNADAAWRDVVRIWKETDRHRSKFIGSVADTLEVKEGSDCGDLTTDNCRPTDCPRGANGPWSGPAAQFIWNSLVGIHVYHRGYHDSLSRGARIDSDALEDLEKKLAPSPPEKDESWPLLLSDLISLGTYSTAGPFFNAMLKGRPYFAQKGSTLTSTKDITMELIRNNSNIAKGILDSDEPLWRTTPQNTFSGYMYQAIKRWAEVTSLALEELFSGTDEGLEILWSVMSDGKLTYGAFERRPQEPGDVSEEEIKSKVAKTFFAYTIPALWQVSKTYAFILNSGYGCDEDSSLRDYLDNDTMNATGVCFEDKKYYLVHPDKGKKFTAPPGLEFLASNKFGGITKEDLVDGSVRTWINNGNENRGGFADPIAKSTMEDLVDANITTPGFMRIPVCSPERAFQSWTTAKKDSSAFYPCDIPPGKDTCRESTYEDQTSDASPSYDDCLTITKNIEGDASTDYTHQVVGKRHRELVSFGSCSFGVEATKVHGNVDFVVGGQNIIDIIRESIKKFSRGGKVGAKGEMSCNGNIKDQPIKWGIY